MVDGVKKKSNFLYSIYIRIFVRLNIILVCIYGRMIRILTWIENYSYGTFPYL